MATPSTPPGYAKVPERYLFEARGTGYDINNTRYVLIKEADLTAVTREIAQLTAVISNREEDERSAMKKKIDKLQTTAQGTATVVSAITDALSQKFGLKVQKPGEEKDEEDDEVFEETPPPLLLTPPQRRLTIPLHSRAGDAEVKAEIKAAIAVDKGGKVLTTSKPNGGRKRKLSQQPKGTPSKRQSGGGGAEVKSKGKHGEVRHKVQDRYKMQRKVTPLPDGFGCAVSWKLNSLGCIVLNAKELEKRADTLTNIQSVLSTNKLKKLWEADRAGDQPGAVSDLAVGLVNHIAVYFLGDLAKAGPVVLEKDIVTSAGSNNEDEFIEMMPEPIKTGMVYIASMCFVGTETAAQRMEILEDVAINIKPYIEVIRQERPFPPPH